MKRYSVRHPLLKRHIKFFWEIRSEYMDLNHKIIPVRNIDLKFNLSDTVHYLNMGGERRSLEDIYFSGLRDQYRNNAIVLKGKVHVIGICFYPEGVFPFFKIPVSEFKNQLLGADEVGFHFLKTISEQLRETKDISARLSILENELLTVLDHNFQTPDYFMMLFNSFKQYDNPLKIADFCDLQNVGKRKLERLFNKYVGVSAKSFCTLNRFQNSMNQLLMGNYSKLSDVAYANEYFDQMHFIKDFKRFAGNTPKRFVRQKDSMLHIGRQE